MTYCQSKENQGTLTISDRNPMSASFLLVSFPYLKRLAARPYCIVFHPSFFYSMSYRSQFGARYSEKCFAATSSSGIRHMGTGARVLSMESKVVFSE
jgi:hypothetical protein